MPVIGPQTIRHAHQSSGPQTIRPGRSDVHTPGDELTLGKSNPSVRLTESQASRLYSGAAKQNVPRMRAVDPGNARSTVSLLVLHVFEFRTRVVEQQTDWLGELT